jgi:hypothetical protein
MVVCAVPCEPVSTEYFPVLRENNRVLRDFWALGAVLPPEKPLCRSGFSINSLRKLTGKSYSDNRDRNRINSEIRSGYQKRPFLAHSRWRRRHATRRQPHVIGKTVNEMLDHVSARPVRVIRIFRLN